MASDPLLTALPLCPSLDISSLEDNQRSRRKSTFWRHPRRNHVDGVKPRPISIAEEVEAPVNVVSPAQLGFQLTSGHRSSSIPTLVDFETETTKIAIACAIGNMGVRDEFERQLVEDSGDSDSQDVPSEECEDERCRGPQPPVWHCVDCDSSYCSDCWPLQGPHKPKKKGRDGVPHEKTDPRIVRRLKSILNPSKDADQIHRLHEDDEATKWFGVTRDITGKPNFEDYGRYASLMASISPIESMGNRYPVLTSFIGVTNAGKSTLIKMLVNHDSAARNVNDRVDFPSPVVGSVVNDTLPTSGDVHLYADPSTHAEQLPILYADCEGFEGGERTPLGAKARRRANAEPQKPDSTKLGDVHIRPIEWAVTEDQRQREYAVTALYPRLLYTFSDCVVFVLRNPKTFQSAVLTKLLDWGVSALEKSINQPALPHCIVALNGTDPAVDEKEWDINYATQSLLSSVKGALDYVEGVPRFRELAEHWRALGKHIYTVEDLILRYYSSFKVIRIPSKPRYMLINDQVGKLHQIIKSNCEENFKAKRRARMLTNADEMNTYLQSGFDHFTAHLDVPFNFMQISLLRNPIPNDFGGHILQLLTTISYQQPNHQPGRVAWMFEKLAVMLASCVLLDCARFRKGRVDELFTNYEKFFNYALSEYLELHYPCSYVSADGTRHCMLVKARHQPKGHQDEKGIIAAGDYETAFDSSFPDRWKMQLRGSIHRLQQDFQYELEQLANGEDTQAIPEESLALDLHIEYLNRFYEAVGPASAIISHATCFCCLMDVSEHALPCGHVLCTACIKAYGKASKTSCTLACCPLHREATKWTKPALIRFKPAGAGVRVLCLDGGGIRGIVQLEVLRAIEQILGGYIDVQAFFDLIIGTGMGGMLSVALALKDRTVDSCIDQFKAICEHAFTPRLKGIPIVSTLVAAFGSGRKYKTKPLYSALKTAFGEDNDLFGPSPRFRTGSRVGMTSTTVTGRESILLANYRRPEDLMPAYQLDRPHEPNLELKIWEAVAASMANPAHFKSFSFHGKTYLDGGIRMPNPSFIADRERRLIWPDVGEPDIFLSLGTGQHRMHILNRLAEKPLTNNNGNGTAVVDGSSSQASTDGKRAAVRRRNKKADDVLDAEIAWLEFRDYAVRQRSDAGGRRFVRLNPDLEKEPPAADSKSDIESIQLKIRKSLQLPHRIQALRNVAHRLVASSFYLDLQTKSTAERSEQICTGSICCRFEDGSIEMAALGRVLEDRTSESFQPYFHIRPDARNQELASKVIISTDVLRGMTDHGVCSLPTVQIPLKDESKASTINLFLTAHDGLEPEGFSISNMPRIILGEKKAAVSARRPRRTSLEHRGKSESSMKGLQRLKHSNSNLSDHDSISLNGPTESGHKSSESNSADSWQDVQSKVPAFNSRTGAPKMSLADIIAQSQGNGTSIKQRTNRFWTYIGNNHIALHPELYTPEEVARFAANTQNSASALPAELESIDQGSTQISATSDKSSALASSRGLSQTHELEGTDGNFRHVQELQHSQQTAKVASVYQTEVEDDGGSSYSGQEHVAHASPVVKNPPPYTPREHETLETVVHTSLPSDTQRTSYSVGDDLELTGWQDEKQA